MTWTLTVTKMLMSSCLDLLARILLTLTPAKRILYLIAYQVQMCPLIYRTSYVVYRLTEYVQA